MTPDVQSSTRYDLSQTRNSTEWIRGESYHVHARYNTGRDMMTYAVILRTTFFWSTQPWGWGTDYAPVL